MIVTGQLNYLGRKIDTRTRDWKSKSLMGTYCGITDALTPNPPEGIKLGAELVVDEPLVVVDELVLDGLVLDELVLDELVLDCAKVVDA